MLFAMTNQQFSSDAIYSGSLSMFQVSACFLNALFIIQDDSQPYRSPRGRRSIEDPPIRKE